MGSQSWKFYVLIQFLHVITRKPGKVPPLNHDTAEHSFVWVGIGPKWRHLVSAKTGFWWSLSFILSTMNVLSPYLTYILPYAPYLVCVKHFTQYWVEHSFVWVGIGPKMAVFGVPQNGFCRNLSFIRSTMNIMPPYISIRHTFCIIHPAQVVSSILPDIEWLPFSRSCRFES